MKKYAIICYQSKEETTQEILESVNISKNTLYNYFRSHENESLYY